MEPSSLQQRLGMGLEPYSLQQRRPRLGRLGRLGLESALATSLRQRGLRLGRRLGRLGLEARVVVMGAISLKNTAGMVS